MEDGLKRWIFCFLTIVMVTGCAAKDPEAPSPPLVTTPIEAPPPELEQELVAVTATRLNLRSQGTTESKVLHVLDNGDELTVLAREKSWIQVRTDTGIEGWVAARYTTARDIAPAGAAPPSKAPDQTPIEPPVVVEKPPESPPEKSTEAPPPPKQTTEVTAAQAGEFTQEDAVAAYSRFRQTMVDGDFEAFLKALNDPPGPDEADPQEFSQMKDFLLAVIPDPAAWEVLKFDRDQEKALLVVRSELDNPDNITLSPLFFFASEGQWKMHFDFSPETLPRQDPQSDQAYIAKALEANPALQLAGAPAEEPEPAAAAQAEAPPPPPVPAENGLATGEMVVNGDTRQLHYAYAYPEKSLSDPDRVDTIVILANTELDYEALDSWARRSELEDIGKLFCVELTVNPEDQVISRRMRHHAFDGSPSGVSYLEKFEPQDAGQGIIAGQAYSTAEGEFFGVTYQYRAAFRAEIKAPEKAAESEKSGQTSAYTITRPAKEDLTRVPRYMEDTAVPVFTAMDAKAVVGKIKVVSNRTTALFGFNNPEVVVYLPAFGNSAYAVVEFDDPRVVDAQGSPVLFERESGGYSDDTFSAEIRMAPKEGDDPVEFARVKGTGRIKYPLRVETQSFEPGQAGSEVEFDGPYVTYVDKRDPDMPFLFTDTGPVRAYDATGGRLREGGYSSTSMRDNITRKTVAYRGNVTELQVDVPEDWVDIEFTYDLPPMAPKPEVHAGRSATRPDPIVETPGGKVSIKVAAARQSSQETPSDDTTATGADSEEKADEEKPCNSLQECMQMSDLQIAIVQSGIWGEEKALQLIEQGADLTYRDKIKDTPLHSAVNHRPLSTRIIRALLAAGAEVDAANEYGYTPLHNLSQGAQAADAPFVKMLIEAGADINLKDHYGMTPLYHMTINGMGCKGLDTARLLIQSGADVNIKDKYGKSPLASARENKCDELAEIFLQAGAL